MPSASGCRRPRGPTRLGPWRSWIQAETRRSTQLMLATTVMTTKKNSAILTTDSRRTRAITGSISGPRRRAGLAEGPVRQTPERRDRRRHLVEDRRGGGVLARQIETASQV